MQISQTNQLITKALFGLASVLAFATVASAQNASEEEGVEEIIVTGSFIRGTPEDAPNPVTIVTREDLINQGNPTVVELIKNLGPSSGIDGETNQFASNALEGAANVNLRGLGPARTLTLFNGKRLPYSGVSAVQLSYQAFVNINTIPLAAVGRLEVLRDGASATYGSDAVAGVANFLTRDDFVGFEVQGSHRMVDDTDGWTDLGFLWGADLSPDSHILVAFGTNERTELRIRDRDYALQPYAVNPAGGWSGIGNPALFGGTGIFPGPLNAIGLGNDPGCADFGGGPYAAVCRFQFTAFDNLIEDEMRDQIYVEWDHSFAGGSSLEVSGLIANIDVPEWKTSPAYPPASSFLNNKVDGSHTGLQSIVTRINAGGRDDTRPYAAVCPYSVGSSRFVWASPGNDGACASAAPTTASSGLYVDSSGATPLVNSVTCTGVASSTCNGLVEAEADLSFRGRYLGWGADSPEVGSREYSSTHITADYDFELSDRIDAFLSFTHGVNETTIIGRDMLTQRLAWALAGLGGPNCGGALASTTSRTNPDGTPASGFIPNTAGCEYYNPFSNALEFTPLGVTPSQYINDANPNYDPTVKNSQELLDWLTEPTPATFDNVLTTFEAVFTGEFGSLAGGPIAWAGGGQLRLEEYTGTYSGFNNRTAYPCVNEYVSDCTGATERNGVYAFLSSSPNFSRDETVFAGFGELNIPLLDNLTIQAAVRFESYDTAGESIDPKISVRWDPMDQISVRGSFGTSFKAPQLSQNGLIDSTSLSFIPSIGTFKAVDASTTPGGLEPEEAENFNAGIIVDIGNFFLTADFWSISVDSPIITESHVAIVDRVCPAVAGVRTCDLSKNVDANGDPLITFSGTPAPGPTAANLSRIAVQVINGNSLETSGLDIALRYNFDGPVPVTLGMEWSQLADYTLDGVDYLGKLNKLTSVRPLPEDKMRFFANAVVGSFNINGALNTTSSYSTGTASTVITEVASYSKFDVNVAYRLNEDSVVFVNIDNLTDEDPPLAPVELNYDPYTHSPLGQTLKVGVNYKF